MPNPTPSLPRDFDYLSEQGAHMLAGCIRAYWKCRGKQVEVWVRKHLISSSPSDGERSIHVVESSMVGGRP